MRFFIGKTSHAVGFRSKNGQCHAFHRWGTYHLREDAGLNLLQKGAQLFEARAPQAGLVTDLALLPEQGEVDAQSITHAFIAADQRETLPNPDHKLRSGRWTFDGSCKGSLRYNGVRVFNAPREAHSDFRPDHVFDADVAGAVKDAGSRLHLQWMAESLGHRIEDFPKVSAAEINQMIEETDFGYDF